MDSVIVLYNGTKTHVEEISDKCLCLCIVEFNCDRILKTKNVFAGTFRK